MADIGTTLREARMRAKIDISEVEAETKIRAKYLRALENEEWSLLPGSTFVKTFLRTYADYLGLDGKILVEEYKVRFEPVSTAELQPFKPQLGGRREPTRPRGPSRGAVIGVVIVLLVAVLYGLGKLFPSDSGDEGSVSRPRTSTGTTAAQRTRERARHRSSAAAPAKPRKAHLQLVATGSVWICLVDGTGHQLIPGQIVQPQTTTAPTTYTAKKFLVNFGNGRVQMKLNGRTLEVPDTGGPVGYSVTGKGRTLLPPNKSPTCA